MIGYLLTLFAVVAGIGAFPFSNIWMGLLFVVVGVSFVVAVPVLVTVYLFFCMPSRGFDEIGRRFLLGETHRDDTRTVALEKRP